MNVSHCCLLLTIVCDLRVEVVKSMKETQSRTRPVSSSRRKMESGGSSGRSYRGAEALTRPVMKRRYSARRSLGTDPEMKVRGGESSPEKRRTQRTVLLNSICPSPRAT